MSVLFILLSEEHNRGDREYEEINIYFADYSML